MTDASYSVQADADKRQGWTDPFTRISRASLHISDHQRHRRSHDSLTTRESISPRLGTRPSSILQRVPDPLPRHLGSHRRPKRPRPTARRTSLEWPHMRAVSWPRKLQCGNLCCSYGVPSVLMVRLPIHLEGHAGFGQSLVSCRSI